VDGLADKSRSAVIGNRHARFCPAAIAAAVSPKPCAARLALQHPRQAVRLRHILALRAAVFLA
jgi:hypothetical protein